MVKKIIAKLTEGAPKIGGGSKPSKTPPPPYESPKKGPPKKVNAGIRG